MYYNFQETLALDNFQYCSELQNSYLKCYFGIKAEK